MRFIILTKLPVADCHCMLGVLNMQWQTTTGSYDEMKKRIRVNI